MERAASFIWIIKTRMKWSRFSGAWKISWRRNWVRGEQRSLRGVGAVQGLSLARCQDGGRVRRIRYG